MKKGRRLLAILMAICLVCAYMPVSAFGGTAKISVTFRSGSEGLGWIELKNGNDWAAYNGSGSQQAEAVRIRTNTDYSVDWTAITLKVNGEDILTYEIKNELTSDSGYTLTADTVYALEDVEFRQNNGNANTPETCTVNFGSGSWIVGDQTVTADKSGTIDALAMDEVIKLTGFDANTMQVKLAEEGGGFSTTLTVVDSKTSLSAKNCEGLPGGTLVFSVEAKSNSVDPEPGPEPGDEPAHGGYRGDQKTASVTVTGKADFYINDSQMANLENGSKDVNYTYDGKGYVDFYFNCFINQRITTLNINGTDYYNNLPNPSTAEGRAALLAACKGQTNEFKITVPYSESYTIESSVKWLDDSDKDYMVVGNFLWTYTDENQGDDYIDHGRMELIKVSYNDKDYLPDELNNPGTAIDWNQDQNGGSAVLPAGATVTVKLIPDYGYQLTSFGINGGSFGTGDEQSVFTFDIKPGNAHLGARFTPVSDKVTTSSDAVTSGSIELGSSLSGGTVQLEISDAKSELSNEKLEAFENASEDYTIKDYMNLDLYNVYYKGSTDSGNVWKNEVDELDKDATISVSLNGYQLAGTANPADIVIIHNIHNGENFETITVDSYDPGTNTITFKTDSFSTYAIATTSGGSNGGSTSGSGGITVIPSLPSDNDITNSGSGFDASTSVDVSDKTTVTDSKAETKVDADLGNKIVENALKNNSTDVVINAGTSAGDSAGSTVTLPESTVKALAKDTEASVTIKTDSAEVSLDKDAVAAVAAQAGSEGEVKLVVETKEQNKNKVEIELTLVTSNGTVSSFNGGTVTVTVPVSQELADKKVVCVYIDENGKYHKVDGAINEEGTHYTFTTGHFSTYAVMSEEDAEAVIRQQTADEQKAKIKQVKAIVTLSTKGLKKGIRVTVKVPDDQKADKTGIIIYRSTSKTAKTYAVYKKVATKDSTYIIRNTKNVKGQNLTAGKKYYYKVRAYKVIDGKTYYGPMSSVKSIKAK